MSADFDAPGSSPVDPVRIQGLDRERQIQAGFVDVKQGIHVRRRLRAALGARPVIDLGREWCSSRCEFRHYGCLPCELALQIADNLPALFTVCRLVASVRNFRYGCDVSTQTEQVLKTWTGRLAASVGERVKHYRTTREPRMSAQQLADATEKLGHTLTRATIAGMESGKRGTVTVADILVLAAVLDVAPVLLVFPVGTTRPVELAPDTYMDPLDAADWWSGLQGHPTHESQDERRQWIDRHNELKLLRQHRLWVARWQARTAHLQAVDEDQDRESLKRYAEAARAQVADTRSFLRRAGALVPDLPASLVIDDDTSHAS